MSRNPINISGTHMHQKMAAQYANFIAPASIPRAIKIDDAKQAAENDDMMQGVIALFRNGRWFQIKKTDVATTRECYNVRNELTVTDDNILLCGKNIVISASLIHQVVALAHEGHQGIVKTKELLRSKVWFPQMNDIAESAVRRCFAVQCTQNSNPHLEPMQMSDMPGGAWRNLSIDFLGPLPSGKELMVLVDEYSRFPIVEIIRSVSANRVIPVLDKHLATFGYHYVIKSDNVAPFNSDAFASFAKHSGFRHRRVTECWPRGNAQAEGFNKPLTKAIRLAVHSVHSATNQCLSLTYAVPPSISFWATQQQRVNTQVWANHQLLYYTHLFIYVIFTHQYPISAQHCSPWGSCITCRDIITPSIPRYIGPTTFGDLLPGILTWLSQNECG